MPFLSMHALASHTRAALYALLSGHDLRPATFLQNANAPTLFDWAHAMKAAGKPMITGYWSSHGRATLDSSRVKKTADTFVALEDLLGHGLSDVEEDSFDTGGDRLLADRFARDLEPLSPSKDALFAMAHFSGTHAPYAFDETAHQPFEPFARELSFSSMGKLRNSYKNAIHEQDIQIARAIEAFQRWANDTPWIVLFTSDHGESFLEHGAIHHGQALFAEQIRVPAFLAASPGALEPAERDALAKYRSRATTHLDIVPTVAAAWGIDASPVFIDRTRDLGGRSLMAPPQSLRDIAINNCTPLALCPVTSFGALNDRVKVLSVGGPLVCFAMGGPETDPLSFTDGDECSATRASVQALFSVRP